MAARLAETLAIIAVAVVVGRMVGGVVTRPETRELAHWGPEFAVLLGAVLVRGLAAWTDARFARRAAAKVTTGLRDAALRSVSVLSPRRRAGVRDEAAYVLGTGLSGLHPWLTGYLPSLIGAIVVTPLILVVLAVIDPASAAIAVVTLPLIPVFMVLVGLLTRNRTENRLRDLTALGAQVLDLVAGLPTLRALGREQGPARSVGELGRRQKRSAMAALRIAFLSSMVLELLATLSVALIAVAIGMRLVFGEMDLAVGVTALVLAPEVYMPVRLVGARFHDAEDGAHAAGRALDLIEAAEVGIAGSGVDAVAGPVVDAGSVPGDTVAGADADADAVVRVRDLRVATRGGHAPDGLSFTVRAGEIVALTGANGAGKSTAVDAVLGLIRPGAEGVTGDVRLATGLRESGGISWLPQRPVILAGTVAENLRAGDVDPTLLGEASRATGFDAVLAELPAGGETVLGRGGDGLSRGQAHRLALTRVLASPADLLILDEPTAHVDADTEARVLAHLRLLSTRGVAVLLVAHRPALVAAADRIVAVECDRHVGVAR